MERALLVEVTTYGFLHAGQGPLRREVLKRSWPWLPGATVYGALQAALIQLDGLDGPRPGALVAALCSQQVRFTPFLPDTRQHIHNALTYCQQAQQLAAAEAGQPPTKPPVLRYQTTPHAPISRRQGQIEGSLLYALESHQPQQRYCGWIFCPADQVNPLRQALGLLPLLPLGGKGKFTSAEATILADSASADLRTDLAAALCNQWLGPEITLELLSPMIFQASDWGILGAPDRVQVKSPRRYRAWRTGIYPDATQGRRAYGVQLTENQPGRVGQASAAVIGWPEGSRFSYAHNRARAERIAQAFVEGAGRSDWACLGWGQPFVRREGEGE